VPRPQAAQQDKTDILVLGTHGRSGVMRALLGRVAARVVATASCPVLTVRMPAEARR
jgi:nucleotide-binding universal stress UspA family protein